MLAGWVGYACYWATSVNPSFAWRFPLCMQCLAPAVFLLGSPWLPRSPRWLIAKGALDEARTVLERLRQSPDDPEDLVAKEEFYQIYQQLKLDEHKLKTTGYNTVWVAVWKRKSYRWRMVMGFLLQWGAEFGGPLVITNYAVILYRDLGQTGGMPLLLSAVWGTTAGLIYIPGGAWLQDKINSRRAMYITGLCGCLVTTACLSAMIAQYAGTTNRVGNGFGVFFIFLCLAFQGTGCGTTMYTWGTILMSGIFRVGHVLTLLTQCPRSFVPRSDLSAWASHYSANSLQRPSCCKRRRSASRKWAGSSS